MKVELAGFADMVEEVVRKGDSHIQIRKQEHRSLKNLLWTLSQPQQAVCSHRACLAAGPPRGRNCFFLTHWRLPCLCKSLDLIKDRSPAHK